VAFHFDAHDLAAPRGLGRPLADSNSNAHVADSLASCAAGGFTSVARCAQRSASAAFAIDAHRGAGALAPEWITLIPAANFKGFDGRGPYRLDQPAHVVAATEEMIAKHMTAGLPLDFDHATDFAAPEGRQAPAARWIKQVRAVNGAIQGRIEWTPKGKHAVEAHEYRYVSPVFEYDDEGRVVRLLRAALTNNPNLNLPAIASAESARRAAAERPHPGPLPGRGNGEERGDNPAKRRPSSAAWKGEKMHFSADEIRLIAVMAKKGQPLHETVKSLMEALPGVHPHKILDMAKLAMSPDAADGDAHDTDAAADADDGYDAESTENPFDGETAEAMTARQADELARCATDEERAQCTARHTEEQRVFERRQAESASAHHRAGAATAEPHGKVKKTMTKQELDAAVAKHPMVLSLNRALNDMRGERSKEKAERMVDDAIASGKLIPAQREWAVTYCTAYLTGFQKFIGAQPALSLDDKGSPIGRQPPRASGDALTPAELAICAQTRCTPQEYLKRKQYLAARITGVAAQAAMLRIEVGSAA
jgi:phage I-like protein